MIAFLLVLWVTDTKDYLLFSHWVVSDSVIPWTSAHQASLSLPISQSLLTLMSIESVHPTISASVTPFSSYHQSFPASGSFPMSRLFTSGGFSHWSFSFSNSPSNEVLFPLGLTGLISLMSKGLSKVFSSRIQKHQSFGAQPSLWSNSHIHTWLLEKL